MTSYYPPIMLRREGDFVVVEIDTGVKDANGNSWVEVIREYIDGSFSHIVEPGGIDRAVVSHFRTAGETNG